MLRKGLHSGLQGSIRAGKCLERFYRETIMHFSGFMILTLQISYLTVTGNVTLPFQIANIYFGTHDGCNQDINKRYRRNLR